MPTTTSLRLHQVLRAEHELVPSGAHPAGPAEGIAARAALPPRAPGDAPATEGFDLVDGEGLAARISGLLPGRGPGVRAAVAAAPALPASTAAVDEDGHYARLAEWVREGRGARPPAGGEASAGGGGAAVLRAAVAVDAAGVTPAEIGVALTRKLAEDLPVTEPWIQNADLRPFTRGLLKRHLAKRSLPGWMFGRKAAPDPELNRLLLEDTFAKYVTRRDDRLLREVFGEMRESGRAALCLSGGGIRSATFALGMVQGLARHGVLGRFGYLSTVSGGGYLGSWLSAWSRHEGFDSVVRKLGGDTGAPGEVEPAPVRHLRQYSNYLSPRLGLFSGDTWTLAATYLRNLLLIWLVLVPLLAGAVAFPWLFGALNAYRFSPKAGADPSMWVAGLVAASAVLACAAIAFVHANRPEPGEPGEDAALRARRDQGAFLRLCLVPLVLAVGAWAVAWHWFAELPFNTTGALARAHQSFGWDEFGFHPLWTAGTLLMMAGAAAVHLAGWLVALRFRGRARVGWELAREFLAIVATGAAAGFLLVLTSNLLQNLAGSRWGDAPYAALAVPGFLTAVLLAGFAFEGLASRFADDARREWNARYSAWLLVVAVAWAGVFAIVLFGPNWVQEQLLDGVAPGVGAGSGILAALLGRSAGSGKNAGPPEGKKKDWGGLLSRITLPVAAVVAVVSLVVALSYLDVALMRWACSWETVHVCREIGPGPTLATLLKGIHGFVVLGVVLAPVALGLGLSRLVETNRFSLHAMYRARLIRAYLGASRPAGERRPDPFTGFDDADNLPMGCLGGCGEGVAGEAGGSRPPFHVLNLALNLVAGRNLAWQERKAASFTVSPLHAGAMGLGYRATHVPGQACPTPEEDARYYGGKRGITLGTAMTISGAAASPNMGYHSSPAITFLMTLFNARLGWWLGNPGPAGDETFHDASPRFALRPLLDEMLGATDDTNPYVYLSDGGHFDNLGLYEMVLRRNRFVVVSDAGADEACSLDDLGNAIRKIRIDQGIPIEFGGEFLIRARSADPAAPAGQYWAFGRIRYSCVDAASSPGVDADALDGVLLYVKPGIYGGEPRDVFNYAAATPAFPHESTADQFFSESQFESYRALGSHALERIAQSLDDSGGPKLADLFTVDGQTAFLRRNRLPASAARPVAGTGRKIKIDGLLVETP